MTRIVKQTYKYVLLFDGRETTGLYEIRFDMSNNLAEQLPDIKNELEQKAKAFLQQYTTRMVDNKLIVNP